MPAMPEDDDDHEPGVCPECLAARPACCDAPMRLARYTRYRLFARTVEDVHAWECATCGDRFTSRRCTRPECSERCRCATRAELVHGRKL